jgi:hypothetical protein
LDFTKVFAVAGGARARTIEGPLMKMTVEGIAPFINRLEKFDKDVSKSLKKDMRTAADEVRKAAVKRVPNNPVSGWGRWRQNGRDLDYDTGRVKKSYKTVTNRYRNLGVTAAFGYSAVTENAAAAIFEQVGADTPKGNTSWFSSEQFRRTIINRHGPRPRVKGGKRVLMPAYYEAMPAARRKIEKAIREAERKVGL